MTVVRLVAIAAFAAAAGTGSGGEGTTTEIPALSARNRICSGWVTGREVRKPEIVLHDGPDTYTREERRNIAADLCRDVSRTMRVDACAERVVEGPFGRRFQVAAGGVGARSAPVPERTWTLWRVVARSAAVCIANR